MCGQKSSLSDLFSCSITVTCSCHDQRPSFKFFRFASAMRYCSWMPWFSVFFQLHFLCSVLQLKKQGIAVISLYASSSYNCVWFLWPEENCSSYGIKVTGFSSDWAIKTPIWNMYSFYKINGWILNIVLKSTLNFVLIAVHSHSSCTIGLWCDCSGLVL